MAEHSMTKPPSKIIQEVVNEWLERANEDLRVAELLYHDGGFLAPVAFHAQQAAEKFLKAYLSLLQVEFPKTHDLDKLIELLPEKQKEPLEKIDELTWLSKYAVMVRYPGDFHPLAREEVKRAIILAKQVQTILVQLGLPR